MHDGDQTGAEEEDSYSTIHVEPRPKATMATIMLYNL